MQVAVKVLTKKRGSQARGKVLRKIAREIDLLTKLQECCNVIQLLTVYEDEDHAYLVCELCRGGDLEKVLMVGFTFIELVTCSSTALLLSTYYTSHIIEGIASTSPKPKGWTCFPELSGFA